METMLLMSQMYGYRSYRMVRLTELDRRVNIWFTEQHISSNVSALVRHSATCRTGQEWRGREGVEESERDKEREGQTKRKGERET